MIINVKTAPTVEPITVSEVKDHLRITTADFDTILGELITAAREYVEKITGRALVQRTLEAQYKDWHNFDLPYPPVISVDSIEYTDTDGNTSTVDASIYSVVSDASKIILGYGQSWPTATLHPDEYPVKVTYKAGYEPEGSPLDYTANIPRAIKSAIKMHVELLFDRPQKDYAEKLESAINSLLTPYKVWSF